MHHRRLIWIIQCTWYHYIHTILSYTHDILKSMHAHDAWYYIAYMMLSYVHRYNHIYRILLSYACFTKWTRYYIYDITWYYHMCMILYLHDISICTPYNHKKLSSYKWYYHICIYYHTYITLSYVLHIHQKY